MSPLVLVVKPLFTDSEIAAKEGYFMTAADFPTVIKEDCDVYRETSDGSRHLLLKFRKGVLPVALCATAFKALETASKVKRNNRGAAAGLFDATKLPAYVKAIVKQDKYRVYYIGNDGKLAKTHLSNYVASNIIGYYDKPDRNAVAKATKRRHPSKPCRMTQFTRKYPRKWTATVPLLQAIDEQFKSLMPEQHQSQLLEASKTPNFTIEGTSFSTATINYNYRTALHRDRGDYEAGFGNLVVLEKVPGSYVGGWTGFPQFGVAVDVRQGDFLAMDVHQWHGNVEMQPATSSTKATDMGRLAVVCYLRKSMSRCS